MTDFYREQIVKKPRKKHKCFLCLKEIEGKHVYISCKHYDFWTARAHISCNEEAKKMCNNCSFNGDCEADLSECYQEMHREREKVNDCENNYDAREVRG